MSRADHPNAYPTSENLNAACDVPLLVLNVRNGVAHPRNPGFGIMHRHQDVQVVLAHTDDVDITTLNGTLHLAEGEAAVINAEVVHRIAHAHPAIEESAYMSLIFPTSVLATELGACRRAVERAAHNPALPLIHLNRQTDWQREAIEHINHILAAWNRAEVAREGAPDPTSAKRSDAAYDVNVYRIFVELNLFWLTLVEHLDTPAPRATPITEQRIRDVLSYIEKHYREPVTLRDLSTSAGISDSECLRCFRTALQTTPYRYLLDYRLEQAARLLETTNDTISAIAHATGFGQAGHFSKVFKRRFGCAPRAWRTLTAPQAPARCRR